MSEPTITIDRSSYLLLRREANINNRPLLRHVLSLARYLGIGALAHAWFLGSNFDPNSLWSWGYLLAWPFPLIGWLFVTLGLWALYALGLVVACSVLWWSALAGLEWRAKRRRKYDVKKWMDQQ